MAIKDQSKLILGTAQIGFNYGIANKAGEISKDTAVQLLEDAYKFGISAFDTAPAYGDSESLIGSFIEDHIATSEDLLIITKLPKNAHRVEMNEFVDYSINSSLQNLKLNKIDYYLLHEAKDVYDIKLIKLLKQYRSKGMIGEIGASIYTLNEAYAAVENGIKVLQVPVNVFDQRFVSEKFLSICKENEVTLIARSVFLQGLFFLGENELPSNIKNAAHFLNKLKQIAGETGLSIPLLALKFVLSFEEIKHVIIGAETQEQLKLNVEIFNEPNLEGDLIQKLVNEFDSVPQTVIDPRCWEKEN